MTEYLAFIKDNFRWVIAGLLLNFASSFGQTFFISFFGSEIRQSFGLSNGDFGFIYMLATLASAAVLVQLGRLADHMRLLTLGTVTIFGLAAATVSMALANSWLLLLVTLFALRLFGQGMMSHVSMTAMARWFNRFRGRALGFAALGYALGEAVLPLAFYQISQTTGWRGAWGVAAAFLILVVVPVLFFLVRHERHPGQTIESDQSGTALTTANWTRGQVLRDWRFFALVPGIYAPSFMLTATFFHQAHIVEVKGWSMGFWAGLYPIYAGVSILSSLFSGWLCDRWSARQLLPFYLLPMAAGFLAMGLFQGEVSGLAGLTLFGVTTGTGVTVLSAIWAELYGIRFLGAIKALAASGMVFSSALGPGLTGALIDRAIGYETQMLAMAGYILFVSVGFLFLLPVLMTSRSSSD